MTDSTRRLNGRYELEGVVGRGGMAEVYQARDIRLDRIVAIKTLRAELARDQIFQARFRREAQSAASLNHPSIVALYDTGEDTATGVPVPYIVMEFVDGRTVRDLLQDGHKLLPERSLEIIDGVLRALDYSHQAGIVHRDIKPGNVMVTRNGDIKVMDFGIARAMSDAQATMTQTAQVIGTAQYLSPEQARGERVDARSDLYSAGCLLYELLTGRPPFTGDSPVAIAYQHVRENPVPPSRVDPDVPPWADAIVLKAMAKSPADRYQSAADMRADLQRATSDLSVTTDPPTRVDIHPNTQRTDGNSIPAPSQILPVNRYGNLARGFDYEGPSWRRGWTPTPPAPVALKRPTINRVNEASARRTERIGAEVRSFNNAKSSSTAVERIRVSHIARVSTSVDLSKTRALSGTAGIRFIDIVNAQASLGNDLLRHYSLQMDSELSYEQTTEISIPAHTNVEVTFHWFRVWATGMLTIAELARGATEIAEVPFEITVGLSFDKVTRDIE
jgi:serine/threonine protein kinase